MINERFRAARLRAGLLQSEVANLIGTTQGNISSIENSRHVPSPLFRLRLCKLFKVKETELWTEAELNPEVDAAAEVGATAAPDVDQVPT